MERSHSEGGTCVELAGASSCYSSLQAQRASDSDDGDISTTVLT